MNSPGRTAERTLALFLFGLLVFNPPLLSIFDRNALVFGMPLLYVYLFFAWGLMIVLIARNAVAGKAPHPPGGSRQAGPDILLPDGREGP